MKTKCDMTRPPTFCKRIVIHLDVRQRLPTITNDHRRSPTITNDHQRSPTITNDHQRSPTITNDHQ